MTTTHTRTHVYVMFANPYLACQQCGHQATGFHDPRKCGEVTDEEGGGDWWNIPCGHDAGADSTCPSWGPVDGCECDPTCPLPPNESEPE